MHLYCKCQIRLLHCIGTSTEKIERAQVRNTMHAILVNSSHQPNDRLLLLPEFSLN